MAMEITNNYNAYENVYATQKQQTEKKQAASGKETLETAAAQKNSEAGNDKAKSVASYVKKLEKLVPSVEFRVGNACLSAQSGKSLTVNPKLLEKMQNDPKTKKDMEDMIKGVESMSKLAENLAKASGWTIVYQHSYIDENGKYHCRMQGRNDGMLKLSDKLREERRRNSEKLIEKSKEKAAEKEKELEGNKIETEEKKEDGEQEKSGITIVKENTLLEKAEQMILEKLENSEKGEIYLDDDDMQKVIEVAREQEEKEAVKKQGNHANPVGANLDLQI
ncbi:hypothetical protein [Parablautia intestinalis]|uniref:hypothetical protein n=1 Tax=Parablautia intestinalis TaxID=2320100 RepID=UPI00256F50EA|nr:hypothetical protein [Parablautia intestinalis]